MLKKLRGNWNSNFWILHKTRSSWFPENWRNARILSLIFWAFLSIIFMFFILFLLAALSQYQTLFSLQRDFSGKKKRGNDLNFQKLMTYQSQRNQIYTSLCLAWEKLSHRLSLFAPPYMEIEHDVCLCVWHHHLHDLSDNCRAILEIC